MNSYNLSVYKLINPLKIYTVDKDLTYRFFNALIVLAVVTFVILSCDTGATEIKQQEYISKEEVKDTVLPVTPVKEKEPEFIITYKVDSLSTRTVVDSFKNRFTKEEQDLIFALNRMDAWRLDAGDKLVVPDTLTGDLRDYSPFPKHLEILDSIPKTVLISQRIQGIALYEGANLIRWGPVSSGKRSTPTPNGLFYGNYKARKKISTINPDWLMPYYFNFMNFEGVGVHQYSMPGYPASHACVRLRKEDATFVYDWAQQWKLDKKEQIIERNGTPFMVFGKYDYEKPFPWLRMAEDPKDNFLTPAEMDTLKNYVAKYFKDDRNFARPEVPDGEISLPLGTEIETIQ